MPLPGKGRQEKDGIRLYHGIPGSQVRHNVQRNLQ